MLCKRFLIILVILPTVWLLSWLFVLQSAQYNINKCKKQIRGLASNIAEISKSPELAQTESITELERQTQLHDQNLQELSLLLNYKQPHPLTTTVLEFRSTCQRKLRKLKHIANMQGVEIDETLGFPATLPSDINKQYWLSLDLGYRLMLRILYMGGDSRQIRNITKISYPDLNSLPKNKVEFISGHHVQITFESSFHFFMQFIHSLSDATHLKDDQKPLPFMVLDKVSIFRKDVAKNFVHVTLTLYAISINLQGKVEKSKSEQKPSTTQTVPIWDRY